MRASTLSAWTAPAWLAACAVAAAAAPYGERTPASDQSFAQQDWQVVCDNTHVCRVAGYSVEGDPNPVSVMFTRQAGRAAPVQGELQLNNLARDVVHPDSVGVLIDGKPAGDVAILEQNYGEIPPEVTAALLRALAGHGQVAFASGATTFHVATTWHLSAEGASAVLAKMDDFQGRAGTPSALVDPGAGSEAAVVKPVAPPRVQAVQVRGAARREDGALLMRLLAAIAPVDGCPLLHDAGEREFAKIWHLDAHRVLVSAVCSVDPLAGGYGFWVANASPPYAASLVTTAGGGGFVGGVSIEVQQPLGPRSDCVADEEWIWTGRAFVHAGASTSGLCRGVQPLGAWHLPTLVSDVIPAN